LKAKFYFGCTELDSNNWSVDFGGLKQLKQILNNQFDHTLCIAESDPLLEDFKALHQKGGCDLRIMQGVGIEKTAEWCFNAASQFLKDVYGDRCWVEKVEVYEHENNSAIFQKEPQIEIQAPQTPPVQQVQVPEVTTTLEPAAPTTNNQPVQVGSNVVVTNGYLGLFDGLKWGSR
jgi:6-pyruvoyltetrahydropterin/6-carboxytetrahydropterin synthase